MSDDELMGRDFRLQRGIWATGRIYVCLVSLSTEQPRFLEPPAGSPTFTATPPSPQLGPKSSATLPAPPGEAVSRLLDGKSRLDGVPQDFDSLSAVIGQAAADSGSPEPVKAWWLYRCIFSPHPLQERLSLMWHTTSPPATSKSMTSSS
jgi:hypothetical protein